MIKAVIFDFDGTLTNPGLLDFTAIRADISCPPKMSILEFLDTLPPTELAQKQAILCHHESTAARASEPNHAARETLEWLASQGIKRGVLTRNSRASITVACAAMGWPIDNDSIFNAIVSREDAEPKPHPEGVHLLLESFKASPEEALVVGDFRFDIEAGKRAGCRTVLLTNSRKPDFTRDEVGWDYELATLAELPGLIQSLTSK